MDEEIKKELKKLVKKFSKVQNDLIDFKQEFHDFKNNKDTKELRKQKKICSDYLVELNNLRKQNRMMKRDLLKKINKKGGKI